MSDNLLKERESNQKFDKERNDEENILVQRMKEIDDNDANTSTIQGNKNSKINNDSTLMNINKELKDKIPEIIIKDENELEIIKK